MAPLPDSAKVHEYVDAHMEEYLSDLKKFLAIPSISGQPEHFDDLQVAAQFLVDSLRRAGLDDANLVEASGAPLVIASWLTAAGMPTILIYGHYDVQPVDPLDEWITPPFKPTIRDGTIFARGAVDDKGQLLAMIEAIHATMVTEQGLPVNIRILLEGEEESGGAALEVYVHEHVQQIACDAVLIADTMMLGPGFPAITYGARGLLYVELLVHGPRDIHEAKSDVIMNPLYGLLTILAGLQQPDGLIAIPGLYDLVRPTTDAERELWAQYPVDTGATLKQEMGVAELIGEQHLSPTERSTSRPTLDVHGVSTSPDGDSASDLSESTASAKLSLRLVPDLTAEKVLPLLRSRVAELVPHGMTFEVNEIAAAPSAIVDVDNSFVKAARDALTEEFGCEVYFTRTGGTIPIAAILSYLLHVPIVMAGYGLDADGMHAPNEHFGLDRFSHAIHGTVRYLTRVATHQADASSVSISPTKG